MTDFPALRSVVEEAEALGFDSYWIPDHPSLIPDWVSTLAALAVTTSRIRLGTLVACASYREAAVLANQAADIDRLSGGRMVLGIGSGDYQEEFTKLGLAFPTFAERHARTTETIQALRSLWSGESVTLEGTHVHLEEMSVPALPVQVPWIPVLMGGGGERVTLKGVAEYADASNFGAWEGVGGAETPDAIRRKLAALRAHCEDRGRPFETVLPSYVILRMLLGRTASALQEKVDRRPQWAAEQFVWLKGLTATVDEATDYFQSLVDAGIRYIIVRIWEDDYDSMRIISEHVLPRLRVDSGTPS
jgi:alkanesulfonate monooxygenase SsuD/methylene tetrahydromethanopterin reductase-like flavin-dependent oxidoreductase (luciferase family)